jgi:hypothetical protein
VARARAALAGGLLAAVLAFPAHAQFAGSLTLQSDDRLRGVSLSDRRPTLTLSLADDLANGVYFGASATGEAAGSEGLRTVGHAEYLGYAIQQSNGLTWDFGVDNEDARIYAGRHVRLRYTELYGGLSNGSLSGRISISPNYQKQGLVVAYAELNGVMRPADNWRLAAHAGAFAPVSGFEGTPIRRKRYDARLDVFRRFGRAELGLGWAAATPAPLPDKRRSRGGLIASLSVAF